MKLLSAAQWKAWDNYTINHEPISFLDLMERASLTFVKWFERQPNFQHRLVKIYCGNGNNGGDGLAIARLLRDRFYDVEVILVRYVKQDSDDFVKNYERLKKYGDVQMAQFGDQSSEHNIDSIIIDSLLGTGCNRALTGLLKKAVKQINITTTFATISIDLPSGLPCEGLFLGTTVVPDVLYTFQQPKESFFYHENRVFCLSWVVGDIGLSSEYIDGLDSKIHYIAPIDAKSIHKKRPKYSHKGYFGHALIIAGSRGKMGAAILAVKACIRAGAGLVTAGVPELAESTIYHNIPEAMVMYSGKDHFDKKDLVELGDYTMGIGPGLGLAQGTKDAFRALLSKIKTPLVIDADALNIISDEKDLMAMIPPNAILTPHPKEFDRLFGTATNSAEMFDIQLNMSIKHQVIIVLKGAHSRITTPDGHVFINSTGNPGMATAGSGDVLTGIITALLAQRYLPKDAAILGVYLHGLAGDLAIQNKESMESLCASDIIAYLGRSFNTLILK
ncbi:MAG: NAD(P)H-hydrate dehydratase [Saprospiraceae bacterium]